MQNICISCEESFNIKKEDLKFYSKLELPIPSYCPSCREARRMAWCNEGTLYFSSCALCSKRSMSQFSPQSQRVGYCRDCWWSENWNPKDYAMEFNFELPFFYQIKEFLKTVPHCHIHTDLSSENSEFSHHAGHQKNCYNRYQFIL